MVQGAKDGSLAKQVKKTGEECFGPVAVVCGLGAVIIPEVVEAVDCFSSSSTVQTPSGNIAIRNLRLNDSVLTFTPGLGAHYTQVEFTLIQRKLNLSLVLIGPFSLICSGNQKILCMYQKKEY